MPDELAKLHRENIHSGFLSSLEIVFLTILSVLIGDKDKVCKWRK